jgi:hypothetical protein
MIDHPVNELVEYGTVKIATVESVEIFVEISLHMGVITFMVLSS